MKRSQLLTVGVVVSLLVVPGAAAAVAPGQQTAEGASSAPIQAQPSQEAQSQNVTGRPNLNVFVPENRVPPGTATTFEVVLVNDGNVTNGSATNPELEQEVTTARSVRTQLSSPNVSDGDSTGEFAVRDGEIVPVRSQDATITVETNEQAISTFPDGSQTTLPFRVTVDRNAEPGEYTLPLEVTYNYTDSVDPTTGAKNRTTEQKTYNVTLVVEDAAVFSVVDVESSARVGATGTVAVTLRNVGSEAARNASVALTSRNGDLTFGGAGTASRFVGGAWSPGENRTVSYRVRAADTASAQRYSLEATVTHDDESGITTESGPVTLGVEPAPEQTFTVVSADHDVRVGDEGRLALTLRNDGPVAVDDASVTVQSGASAIAFGESASATRYVGSWAPGETRTVLVNATAVPDAETRNYSMEATVAYEDGEGDPGQSSALGFGLRPGPELTPEFEASDVSSTLRVGEEGELTGTITNTGDERATNVVVVFETQSGNISPLEPEYAVGSLDPGESETFTFDIEVSGSTNPGPRQFTLRPQYRDEDDDQQRQAESFDVREEVRAQQDVFEVEAAGATVPRGETTLLEVTVTNTRDEALSSVSAALFADDPITVEDSDAFAERIGPGEARTLTFEVSADSGAIAKQYPVELDFQYDEADGDTQLSGGYNVGVTVTQPEDDGGNDLPLAVLGGVGAAALIGVGLYYRYGR